MGEDSGLKLKEMLHARNCIWRFLHLHLWRIWRKRTHEFHRTVWRSTWPMEHLARKVPSFYRSTICTLVSSNEVIILGGHDNSAGTKDAMMLNLETMKFVKLNSMPYARFLHVTHFYKNSVYVFGGVDNCSCQKMNVNDFRWQQISSYKDFISYNL